MAIANSHVMADVVEVSEFPDLVNRYGVRGVPTLMIFSGGQVTATKVGALPKSKIKEWIESSIQAGAASSAVS